MKPDVILFEGAKKMASRLKLPLPVKKIATASAATAGGLLLVKGWSPMVAEKFQLQLRPDNFNEVLVKGGLAAALSIAAGFALKGKNTPIAAAFAVGAFTEVAVTIYNKLKQPATAMGGVRLGALETGRQTLSSRPMLAMQRQRVSPRNALTSRRRLG